MLLKAKNPDLTGVVCSNSDTSKYPFFLYQDRSICFELNDFIYFRAGGARSNHFGKRPTYKVLVEISERLNIFLEFLEQESKTFYDVDDAVIFQYCEYYQKRRNVNVVDSTVKRAVRDVLSYYVYLQGQNKDLKLITISDESGSNVVTDAYDYNIHAIRQFNPQSKKTFYTHDCLANKNNITESIEYIKSYEIDMWLEAIEEQTENEYIIERWYTYTSLLEWTGSRIEEIYELNLHDIITRYEADEPFRIRAGKQGTKGFGKYRYPDMPASVFSEIYSFAIRTRDSINNSGRKIHDCLFVEHESAKPLEFQYFRKMYYDVIKKSRFANELKGMSNHNFRHRYFTRLLHKLFLSNGRKLNLKEAADEVKRDSLHASIDTLSTYLDLSYNFDEEDTVPEGLSRKEVKEQRKLVVCISENEEALEQGRLTEKEALDNIFSMKNSLISSK